MLLHLAVLRSSSPKPGTWYAKEQSKHVCSVNVQSNSLGSTTVLLMQYDTVAWACFGMKNIGEVVPFFVLYTV